MTAIWKSVVGKLWMTIIALVAVVMSILGVFLLEYIDAAFSNSYEVKRLYVITAIIGFSLSTLFAFFLSSKITQPLLQLKRAADMFTMGEYGTRVSVRSGDEIGELAVAFNHMGDKLEGMIRDLHYEKDHLASILRSMTDAVISFDAAGRIIISNPHGERLTEQWSRLTGEEPAGEQPLTERNIPGPLYEVLRSVIETEKEVVTKIHVGNEVWSVVMDPLYEDGMLREAVAVLRNVTEEHRLEKLRKDFVANVSHELRTPLAMLQGYSEALLDDIAATPEERRELAQVIYDESLRMSRLVKELLDMARMEAGRLVLNVSQVELLPLLQRVHRKFAAYAKERSLTLQLEMPSGDALTLDYADVDKLEQVLTNLLDNAFRHTPDGKEITVRAARDPASDVGDAIRLEVEDQGQGVPPEDLPYIFERFYKADKARTRGASSGGTGLGLAIVKNIIDAHHGKITARSQLGQGTTFTVTLPVHPKSVYVEK
jgi:two-component system, OmpR family, sensor histidine kinase ResE